MSFEKVMGLNVTDEAEYQNYREGMLPILTTFGGSFGFDFKVAEVLRSKTTDAINRVFTIEFPSKERMEEFFSNPEYIEVKNKHFNSSVDSITVIAEHEKNT
ncbi:DUF1330 domain-containing protein [Marinobacter mobilis]|uniref:DUF1330 domain-containing protein n=1 Tax=Marinobacter mobilis TaxID=488533 RepID=A0A1H2SW00_9GAMM|nr:DUF1330 domain-containing protein [Marinobacter mobilis]SDW35655.1 protein of unknown function [Marinobacter mobilis]